jgi:hypothetical protein
MMGATFFMLKKAEIIRLFGQFESVTALRRMSAVAAILFWVALLPQVCASGKTGLRVTPAEVKAALTRAVFDRLVCDRLIDGLCNGKLTDAYITFPVWNGKIDEKALRMTPAELLQLYASHHLPADTDTPEPALRRIKEKTSGEGWKIYEAQIANYAQIHVLIRLFDDGKTEILQFSDDEKRFPSSMAAYRTHIAHVKQFFPQAPDGERRYSDADIPAVLRFYYCGEYFHIDDLSGGTFDPTSAASIAAKRKYHTLTTWWQEGGEERAAYRRRLSPEREKTDDTVRHILVKAENANDVRADWGGYKDIVTRDNMPVATQRFLSVFWNSIPEE